MKKIFLLPAIVSAALFFQACSGNDSREVSAPVDAAEEAYAAGRMATAQAIADSTILGSSLGRLSVDELCRLSILFLKLGETSGEEEANTAFASRAIRTAIARDSDSTMTYLHRVPVDERARAAMLSALSEVKYRTDIHGDTIFFVSDSIE